MQAAQVSWSGLILVMLQLSELNCSVEHNYFSKLNNRKSIWKSSLKSFVSELLGEGEGPGSAAERQQRLHTKDSRRRSPADPAHASVSVIVDNLISGRYFICFSSRGASDRSIIILYGRFLRVIVSLGFGFILNVLAAASRV